MDRTVTTSSGKDSAVTSEETREIIQRFYKALGAGDRDTLHALLTSDVQWQMPYSIEHNLVSGRDAVIDELGSGVVRKFFRRGTFRHEVQRIMTDGEMAVVQSTTSARTHDDQPYAMQYCWVYTCTGGRISDIREYMDTHEAARVFRWPTYVTAPTS
jgi:ketosteroid isomerase-like protein